MATAGTKRRYGLIEAPSILGLKPTGVDRLPQRLIALGLLLTDFEGRAPLVRDDS